MAWNDGELFPVGKEFVEAPVSAMSKHGGECTHDHVVMPVDQFNPSTPTMTQGRVPLHCLDCDETWWEDAANIKGSPWEGK
jgi:hypothetical protein